MAIESVAIAPRPTEKEIHPDLLDKVENAYLRIDAALPTVQMALEQLGNTEEARTFALARWAIEQAHADLEAIYRGEA